MDIRGNVSRKESTYSGKGSADFDEHLITYLFGGKIGSGVLTTVGHFR